MKLKEPLQGLRMIQGHLVIHLALFLVSLGVDVQNYQKSPIPEGLHEDELKAFKHLQMSHLIIPLLIMLV